MESIRPLAQFTAACARRSVIRPNTTTLCRCLHSSASRCATPLPHPTAPGPPPKPPTPSATQPQQRFERRQLQADLTRKGQTAPTNPAKPSSALQKRFWKEVSVKETPEGLQVLLDTRPVRTASRNVLLIPQNRHQLATAIALEWDLLVNAQQALKQHYIPLTSLTSRAVDIQTADTNGNKKIREDIITMLMRYLSTDTLLCWVPEKNLYEANVDMERRAEAGSLRDLQIKVATPIISFLTTHIWPGVEIKPILDEGSIMPVQQPQMTKEVIRGWMSGLPAWELAALERGVLASKSLMVATRLVVEWSTEFAHLRKDKSDAPRFGIEEAAEASSLEVRWQTGMWGEVEDTHDVDKEDLRRQLGSVVMLVHGS